MRLAAFAFAFFAWERVAAVAVGCGRWDGDGFAEFVSFLRCLSVGWQGGDRVCVVFLFCLVE